MARLNKINKGKILNEISLTQTNVNKFPEFSSGDTISVSQVLKENNKTRIQKFTGIVLRVRNSNANKTFIVRKESSGIGVEKSFQINSPLINNIEVIKRGKVRRAYISYMRERSGKSARIKEIKSVSTKGKKVKTATIEKKTITSSKTKK